MDEPRWLNEDEQRLWRLLLAGSRKISRTIDDTLESASGLSASEFAVLVALSEADGRQLRLKDLCADLRWDRSRASHQITRMEKRGLVTRARTPDDARGVTVCLTEEGMARLEAAVPEHVETVRQLVFDPTEGTDRNAVMEFFCAILTPTTDPDAQAACDPDGPIA